MANEAEILETIVESIAKHAMPHDTQFSNLHGYDSEKAATPITQNSKAYKPVFNHVTTLDGMKSHIRNVITNPETKFMILESVDRPGHQSIVFFNEADNINVIFNSSQAAYDDGFAGTVFRQKNTRDMAGNLKNGGKFDEVIESVASSSERNHGFKRSSKILSVEEHSDQIKKVFETHYTSIKSAMEGRPTRTPSRMWLEHDAMLEQRKAQQKLDKKALDKAIGPEAPKIKGAGLADDVIEETKDATKGVLKGTGKSIKKAIPLIAIPLVKRECNQLGEKAHKLRDAGFLNDELLEEYKDVLDTHFVQGAFDPSVVLGEAETKREFGNFMRNCEAYWDKQGVRDFARYRIQAELSPVGIYDVLKDIMTLPEYKPGSKTNNALMPEFRNQAPPSGRRFGAVNRTDTDLKKEEIVQNAANIAAVNSDTPKHDAHQKPSLTTAPNNAPVV